MPKKLALLFKLAETATEDEVLTVAQAQLASVATAEAAKLAAEGQVATLTATLATKDTEVASKATEVATLTAQVTVLTAEKTTLSTEVANLKTNLEKFTAHLATRRAEALRLYKLAEGDSALPAMTALIDNADVLTAESFVSTFGAKAEKLYPMTCTKCKSTEVSRRLSAQADTKPEEKNTAEQTRLKAAVTSIHGS